LNNPEDNLPFFRLVTDGLNSGAAGALEFKFLGEGALVARAVRLIGSTPDSRLDAVVAALEREVKSSRHMSLADNSLRTADMLYPYAALSGCIQPIQFYEIWLDEFARGRQQIPDRPNYRDCEDDFIIYMAGRGSLPALANDSWFSFYKRVYDFNVEQCYWLTHRYIYSTDLGEFDAGVSWVAPALLIIIGKSARWGNFDLFCEAAFCALSTNLRRDDVLLIDSIFETFLPQLLRIQKQADIHEVYHELFVFSLFKLRRDKLGSSETGGDPSRGKILTNFVDCLSSKSSERIVRSLHQILSVSPHTFFVELCLEKLTWLAATAGIKTLFENEIRNSGMGIEPGVYDQYLARVNLDLEKLRGSPLQKELR
jgi:hypothetical protein